METYSKEKPRLTRKEAAEFLNENGFPGTAKTLQKLASVGGGPEYQIFGNKALYQPQSLLEWAQSRLSAPRRHAGEASA
ncbi:DNA-binding protein [Haliea sp. E17]|uniref:DNA-binding protein n=1 Tax=Haliea sp. E17 TaxID=3401576 RepID=UPI003AAD19DB